MMDDLENIFANLKLNTDHSSDSEDIDKYFQQIDIALKKYETTTKWIDEIEKECGPITDEEFDKVLYISEKEDEFSSTLEADAGALRYSIVEIIAKLCLQAEIRYQRNECQSAYTDAMAIFKFIKKHKAYYAQKEYMVGFRYVANCLAIKGHLQEIRNNNESKQVNVSRLKELLETISGYQHFGVQHQVGAIKQYFGGNLLKGSCHDIQLRIIRDVSVKEIITD